MGRNLIVGDIHASYDKLAAVLGKTSYDPDADRLYSVGDLCDRGDQPVQVLDFLMKLGSSFCPVLGNHDSWLEYWLHTGTADPNWTCGNGGDVTVRELSRQPAEWLEALRDWFSAIPLIRVTENHIIMHAGIPEGMNERRLLSIASSKRPTPLYMMEDEFMNLIRMGIDMREYEALEAVYWDRDYLLSAIAHERGGEALLPPLPTDRNIWVGHSVLRSARPFHSACYHLYAIDTGAGMKGPLTLMDMDTEQFWQA